MYKIIHTKREIQNALIKEKDRQKKKDIYKNV